MIPDEPTTGSNSAPNPRGIDSVKQALKSRMTDRGIPSLVALSVKAEVSIGAVKRLQKGQVLAMQVQTAAKLAQALEISIEALIRLGELGIRTAPQPPILGEQESPKPPELGVGGGSSEGLDLRSEYDRLLQQFNQQDAQLQERFQRDTLQLLEPWLLQWSAAAHAAQTNPQLMAIKLLPLLRPIDTLLTQWGVTAIGGVGEELAYDPRLHQVMNGEALGLGTIVRVRFSGYDYQGQVLHRAKVVRL